MDAQATRQGELIQQLKTILRSLGHNPTTEQLLIYTTIIDEDRSGTIDFREFLILISERLNDKTLFDEIVESFKVMDKDNDGCLSRSELKALLMDDTEVDMQQLEETLNHLDRNGDGLIDISSYVRHMILDEG